VFSATVAPVAAGEIGMDATSGRPQAYVGGAAKDLMHTADTVTTAQAAAIDGDGLAPLLTLRKAFTAGGGGAADDVVIYNANAPFGFRILDAWLFVSTGVALATATLRTATGGGGSAVSDAFVASAAGTIKLSAQQQTNTIAANGTLVLRRSDNGIAGEVVLLIAKT
jgi:hypothetical protein